MSDDSFDQEIRKLKQDHENFIAVLLENIEFVKEMEGMYSEDRVNIFEEEGAHNDRLTTNKHPLDDQEVKPFSID